MRRSRKSSSPNGLRPSTKNKHKFKNKSWNCIKVNWFYKESIKLEVFKLPKSWLPDRDTSLWNVVTFKRPVQITLFLGSQCEGGQARKQTRPRTTNRAGNGSGDRSGDRTDGDRMKPPKEYVIVTDFHYFRIDFIYSHCLSLLFLTFYTFTVIFIIFTTPFAFLALLARQRLPAAHRVTGSRVTGGGGSGPP